MWQDNLAGIYELTYITKNGDLNYYTGLTGRYFGVREDEYVTDIKSGL